MIYVLIFLLILVSVLTYLLIVQVNKYNKLLVYTEAYVQFISNLYFKIKESHEKMKEVDHRGSFQADDEVGFIFKELKANTDEIYEFIIRYVNAAGSTEKEE